MPVAGVQYDAAKAGLMHRGGGYDQVAIIYVDYERRHAAAADALEVVGPVGRRQRLAAPVLDAGDVLLAAGIGQVQNIFAAIDRLHLAAEAPPERNLVGIVGDGIVGKEAALNRERGVG